MSPRVPIEDGANGHDISIGDPRRFEHAGRDGDELVEDRAGNVQTCVRGRHVATGESVDGGGVRLGSARGFAQQVGETLFELIGGGVSRLARRRRRSATISGSSAL